MATKYNDLDKETIRLTVNRNDAIDRCLQILIEQDQFFAHGDNLVRLNSDYSGFTKMRSGDVADALDDLISFFDVEKGHPVACPGWLASRLITPIKVQSFNKIRRYHLNSHSAKRWTNFSPQWL